MKKIVRFIITTVMVIINLPSLLWLRLSGNDKKAVQLSIDAITTVSYQQAVQWAQADINRINNKAFQQRPNLPVDYERLAAEHFPNYQLSPNWVALRANDLMVLAYHEVLSKHNINEQSWMGRLVYHSFKFLARQRVEDIVEQYIEHLEADVLPQHQVTFEQIVDQLNVFTIKCSMLERFHKLTAEK